MQQLAQDIDLVVHPDSLDLFFKKRWTRADETTLKERYVLDEEAVQRRGSVSLLHLDSLMKIDIIVPQPTTFDLAMVPYIEMHSLDEHSAAFPVASASEMILWKMARYAADKRTRQDGMEDDAGWNDILGMLKVQGPHLNRPLLEQWAKQLVPGEILEQALSDAGTHDVPKEQEASNQPQTCAHEAD